MPIIIRECTKAAAKSRISKTVSSPELFALCASGVLRRAGKLLPDTESIGVRISTLS